MNLVLDAFERVLYPTGAAAERRRRASTGLVSALTGPIAGGYSTSSPTPSSHHSAHHRQQQHRAVANCASSCVSAYNNRRRRSGTLNGGGGPINSAKNSPVASGRSPAGAAPAGFMPICQSNSLTGISRHQQQQQQPRQRPPQLELYNDESSPPQTPNSHRMSQCGNNGTTVAARSRSSAVSGRRKKSVHVQRKQSVAAALFTALASPSASAESNHRIRRRQSRVSAPSRQWSVPERANIERAASGEEQEEEEEPFQLIQKTSSLALSSPSGTRSPPCCRQMSGEEPASPGQFGPDSSTTTLGGSGSPLPLSSSHSSGSGPVLLGFVPPPVPPPVGTFRPMAGRRLSESACLADWIRLRAEGSLTQALLLRCVDPEPAFPFLQFATLSDQEQAIRLVDELAQNGLAQFGCFEELFALERAKPSSAAGFRGSQGTIGQHPEGEESPSGGVGTSQQHHSGGMSPCGDGQPGKGSCPQHRGLILVCFRLLDEENDGSPGSSQTGSAELESSWLSWTGAAQIYRYSPRAWALRRLGLLRRVHSPPGGPSAPFAYVLLCEFDAILHPSNALAALDMCERLRARNCGLVALYQVRQHFASSGPFHSSVQSLSGLTSNSLSPHWSPNQLRRQQLARMGRSQDERGRQGGGALLRMIRAREGSLGWDQPSGGTAPPIQTQPMAQAGAGSAAAVGAGQQQHWRGQPGIGTAL